MMRNGDTPRRDAPSILTLEELEALLREPPPREPVPPPGDEVDVLLVSKREDDLRMLSEALAERGVRTSIARNPFTALDYLRARPFRAVFSDVAVWMARRGLLFERMEQLEHPVGVVSICDPDRGELEQARNSPALAVLERPLDPRRLREVVERVLGAPVSPAAGESGATAEARAASEREHPTSAGGVEGREGHRHDASGDEAWYRFFFNARREIRGSPAAGDRWARLLDLLLVARGGGAAAALAIDRGSDGVVSLRPLCVRATLAGAGAGADDRARLKDRLQHGLASLRRQLDAGGIAEVEQNGLVVVPFPEARAATTVLVSVAPASRPDPGVPPVFREELAILIGEVERA